ncbi:uncharacterized protein LOC121765292 [Salvia splendens]|uniref:uncharacterized protein LOC121765292 n=1 Tax=Salvia splendens TaxID=180675 RepID=UPI001C25D619|nr:uncharacterized protein LOC121765292 [Salvia splendens]
MTDYRRGKAVMESVLADHGTSNVPRPKQPKGDRSRRMWSDREEEVLLVALKELVAHGWKSDNGFRGGYLKRLEDAMRREFPTTDIKGTPNISSKLSAWKKNYSTLQTILSLSGVGFNLNEDHKIDCDDEQWAHIVKVDANAKLMRNKSWPYLDAWKEIFGKDRANGAAAEDILDAINDMCSQENLMGIGSSNNYSSTEFFPTSQVPDASSPHGESDSVFSTPRATPRETPTNKVQSKKRKVMSELNGMVEMLAKMHTATNERLELLASRIGYEFDLTKARKEVFDLVGVIPGLTIRQQFMACGFILHKVERLDFFMSLPAAAKQEYVMMALEDNPPN